MPKGSGLEAKPGDRGDAKNSEGISKIQSGYAGALKSELSKGYDAVNKGWGGRVKR